MKIFKLELIKDASTYKDIIGAIIYKIYNFFLVKTRDNFTKIIDFECDKKVNTGDRFEI